MKIRINVKGVSKKKSKIQQRICEYPDREMTVEEFLVETVRQSVRDYNEGKEAGKILRLFSPQALEDMAVTGKVSYGDPMDGPPVFRGQAGAGHLDRHFQRGFRGQGLGQDLHAGL